MITSCHGNYSNPFISLGENQAQNARDFFTKRPSMNLSGLLPPGKTEFPKSLVEYSVLLVALIQTIEALERGDIDKFDALVCENLCQIRAVINCINTKDCLESLLKIKTNVEGILEKVKKSLNVSPSKNFDLKTFLENEGLNIHLSANEILFVECFLLTIVKKQTGNLDQPEITDIKLLKNLAPEEKWADSISDGFRKKLIDKIRGEVSRISAPFLRYLACEHDDLTSLEMLVQKNIIPIKGRECPPTYWATKVLVQAILDHRLPVVLWIKQKNELNKLVKEFCLYYKSDSSKNKFIKKSPLLIHAKKLAIVMQADCQRKKGILPNKEISFCEIEQYNLLDIILAYAANHRQYPDSQKDIFVEGTIDATYHFYKKKAIEWRVTRDDPSLFHISHIYCDRLENVRPLKYEINSYLEAVYGDFYRTIECEKIQKFAKDANIDINVIIEEKKLVIYVRRQDDLDFFKFGNKLLFLVFGLPRVIEIKTEVIKLSFEHIARVELELKLKDCDLLMLAILHNNPVKFLTDHKFYWKLEKYGEIISYLTAKPQNFEEPAVMDILSDLLDSIFDSERFYSSEENDPVFEIIINGISRAIDIPDLNERAIDLLLVAGSKYEDEDNNITIEATYYPHIYIRSFARKALKKVLHKEDRVKAGFLEMLKKEPLIRLKIDLLNMFDDGIDDYSDQLKNDKLVKNLSLSWKTWHLTCDDENGKIRQNAVEDLIELIQSEGDEKSLRIAAIRYLCNYFSSMDSLERDLSSFVREYYGFHPPISPVYRLSLFLREQQNYRLKILQFLRDLIQNEATNPYIIKEAFALLLMILQFLYLSSAPSLPEEICEEITLEAASLRDLIIAAFQQKELQSINHI
jgi:hypothetical protein